MRNVEATEGISEWSGYLDVSLISEYQVHAKNQLGFATTIPQSYHGKVGSYNMGH